MEIYEDLLKKQSSKGVHCCGYNMIQHYGDTSGLHGREEVCLILLLLFIFGVQTCFVFAHVHHLNILNMLGLSLELCLSRKA